MNEKEKTWQNNWNFNPIIGDDYMKDIENIISTEYFYCLPVINFHKFY